MCVCVCVGVCVWVPSRVEEVDSKVHIVSLLTLADVLFSEKYRTVDTTNTDPHTLTVEIWKGSGTPYTGNTIASYFRSTHTQTEDQYMCDTHTHTMRSDLPTKILKF